MDVLKFKIYKVTVKDKKTNEEISKLAQTKFKKLKEKAFIGESDIYLLPSEDIDKFIIEQQHGEARKWISGEVMKRHLN